jgi:hypothetical protein
VRFLWAKNMDAAKDIHKEMLPMWACGLECSKYPYSDLIRGVKVTHLFKIHVESTMSDTVGYGPVCF